MDPHRLLFSRGRHYIRPPTGFGWQPPIRIYDTGSGVRTDFDVAQFAPPGAGKAYYVDINRVSSGDGLTWGTAVRTIKMAMAKTDVDVIYVAGGTYNRNDGMYAAVVARDLRIIGVGDVTVGCWYEALSWTKTGGYTNVYNVTRSAVAGISDSGTLTANGHYTKYALVADVATVDATEGSYYINGTAVYVHTIGHGSPGATVNVMVNSTSLIVPVGRKIYIENIKFYGGAAAVAATANGELYAKNCDFSESFGNGLAITGGAVVYSQNCRAYANTADGFNYHADSGVIPTAIEVNCSGFDNGSDPTDHTHNGSTSHDGVHIVRVNGEYYRNHGPNVVDVTTGTRSWNLGCYAHDSSDNSSNCADFMTTTGTAMMWLHRCRGLGSTYQLSVGDVAAAFVSSCDLAVVSGTAYAYSGG